MALPQSANIDSKYRQTINLPSWNDAVSQSNFSWNFWRTLKTQALKQLKKSSKVTF
jgi:hypothetical protein